MSDTLIDDINKLMEDYLHWLKSRTILKKINNDWVEIETPYIDRHNDYLSIYVRRKNDYFEITDGGYIINDLKISGCSFTKQRNKMLLQTLSGFGVNLEKEHIITHASADDFPVKKHSLIQAMLSINDLFFTNTTTIHVEKIFLEDVKDWLDNNDIRYTPSIKICGKTGFDQMFNFVIPKSKNAPERLIRTLNNPNKQNVDNIIFDWLDIESARPEGTKPYVLINNEDKNLSNSVLDSFANYNINAVPWTKKEQVAEKLIA